MSTIPEHIRNAAVAYYETGASMERTAREFGVSRNAVHRWVNAADVARESTNEVARRAGLLDSSPAEYDGGWEWRGGVAYPLEPRRRA